MAKNIREILKELRKTKVEYHISGDGFLDSISISWKKDNKEIANIIIESRDFPTIYIDTRKGIDYLKCKDIALRIYNILRRNKLLNIKSSNSIVVEKDYENQSLNVNPKRYFKVLLNKKRTIRNFIVKKVLPKKLNKRNKLC